MRFLLRFAINAVCILLISSFLPGLNVSGLLAAFLFALVLGAVNAVLRPLLNLLALPITVLTLGIFALIVNAFTFWLASIVSIGVQVESFMAAFWGGILVWIVSFGTSMIFKDKDKEEDKSKEKEKS